MAILKLSLSEFDAVDYNLIAIHTSLEDYRLAYFLNQKLPILLGKSRKLVELNTKNGVAYFSKFSFAVKNTEEQWTLFENKDEVLDLSSNASNNLFSLGANSITTTIYFLPEMKKVNFFLKVENTFLPLNEIIAHLNSIIQISTAYVVEVQNLKSKNNLIF